MKHKAFALAALLLILASILFLYYARDNRHFSCLAQYHVQNEGARANVLMRFIFNGPSGLVAVDGEFVNAAGRHKIISRKILFEVERANDHYLLTSKAIIPSAFDEADNVALSRLLDSFYTHGNRPAQYQIHHNGKGGYVFMSGNVPVMFCAGS
ncbi:hypothetical protein [Mixta gaviniae]|nr:hypothetical protein [Mixta gaviniae]ORM80828.1 hypothetical protein HA44_10600 [Mixta gaviniae]